MKNFKKYFLSTIVSVIAFVAATEVSTASLFFFYQPKMPQELQK